MVYLILYMSCTDEIEKCYHVSPNPFYVARNVPKLKLGIPCVLSVHGLGTHYLEIKKKGERHGQPCLPKQPYLFFGLNFSQRKMPKVLPWIALLLSVPSLRNYTVKLTMFLIFRPKTKVSKKWSDFGHLRL